MVFIKTFLINAIAVTILVQCIIHMSDRVNNEKQSYSNTTEGNNIIELAHAADVTRMKTKMLNVTSEYAYGFYAASKNHLKAAMVNINQLKRFGSKHVNYVIYTNVKPASSIDSDIYLIPYDKLPAPHGYYDDCMTKLLFFNMTKYQRIIYIDVDALVVKSLDILFSLPSVQLASPLAYWEDEPCFTSSLLVIEPDYGTWKNLRHQMDATVKNSKADMDLLNIFYQHKLGIHAKTFPEVLLLPGYFIVLSSHFRSRIHGRDEKREYKNFSPFPDIESLAKQAYVIHFSEQPKPWSITKEQLQRYDAVSSYFYDYNMEFKTAFDNITI